MKATKHDDIEATYKDYIQLVFTVKDRDGNLVTLSDATATYRIAKKRGCSSVLEKTDTDGITLSGSVATVALDTSELEAFGCYFDQLRITKAGKPLMVSEGNLKLAPLIE